MFWRNLLPLASGWSTGGKRVHTHIHWAWSARILAASDTSSRRGCKFWLGATGWNDGILLQHHMASQPRRQPESSLPWKLQIYAYLIFSVKIHVKNKNFMHIYEICFKIRHGYEIMSCLQFIMNWTQFSRNSNGFLTYTRTLVWWYAGCYEKFSFIVSSSQVLEYITDPH